MEQSDNKLKLDEQLVKVVLDDKTSLEARIKKVKFLVRIGADVNANLYGKSVLSIAIEKEREEEFLEVLRSVGAKEYVMSDEERLILGRDFWDTFRIRASKGYFI